ncbi:hypothetical protein 1 [Beihai picorna-like virus 77]|uniref:hypothetical protein 1 n=1 Tax=Beihai picorna-like virus 77 TaxID=1922624 RepID=UPI00090C53D7|nr:hypothetical protein 1 [Beihai picorna-like virus 77]APG76691.1 hypothetical protein 1 [Beihai picorna-like virus 77]
MMYSLKRSNGQFLDNDTNMYAILAEPTAKISTKVVNKNETLLEKIQQGVGIEIDPSGLTHYYLSSVKLNPGKKKNKIVKEEKMKVKKRFFYKPVARKYDFAFDVEDCFTGFCCTAALFDSAPKCRIKTSIQIKSWKRIPTNDDDNKHYEQKDNEMKVIGKTSSSWEERQQTRRNKLQHLENGNIVTNIYGDETVYETLYLCDECGRGEITLAINFRECADFLYGEVEEDAYILTIPWFDRRWLCDITIKSTIKEIYHTYGEEYDWLAIVCDVLREEILSNKEMHALNGNIDKENTKRNSATHRSDKNTRNERLMAKDTKLARDLFHSNAKFIKLRRQKAADKAIMKQLDIPTKHFYSSIYDEASAWWHKDDKELFDDTEMIDDNGEWVEILKDTINAFPEELKALCNWVDVICAVDTIARVPYVSAKILAIKALYNIFQIKGIALAAFIKLVVIIYNFIVNYKDNMPQKHMNIESALNAIVTLILSLIFQRKPNQSHIDACLSSLRQLATTAKGLDYIMEAAKACVKWAKGGEEFDLSKEIARIEQRVSYYTTAQGQKDMRLLQSAYMEITELELTSMMILKYLPAHSEDRLKYAGTAARLNQYYKAIQTSPPAGHGNRKPPVTLHLYGGAGVGKTHLVNLISGDALRTILSLEGLEGDKLYDECSQFEKYMYYNPVANKYKTNYNPAMSKIFVCDDANQVNPHFLKEGQPFPVDMIHFANSHTHLLNVAELENKANANFNSALIIATDNVKTPALDYLTSKDAYKRRIDLQFKVELLPEYSRIHNGVRVVDPSKIDLSKANTHIYVFKDDKETFTYDQVSEKVKEALLEKHNTFLRSCDVFKVHATRGLTRSQPDPPRVQSNQLHLVDENMDVAEKHSWLTDTCDNIRNFTEDNFNHLYYKFCTPSFTRHPIDWMMWHYYTFIWYIKFTSFWQSPFLFLYINLLCKPYLKIKSFFVKKQTHKRSHKILAALGFLITGFLIYRRIKRKTTFVRKGKECKKCRPTQMTTDNSQDDKPEKEQYNSGDASTAKKTKPKEPPKSKIISRPLFKQSSGSNSQVERFAMEEFANQDGDTATKQLASSMAYAMAKILCSNTYIIQFIDEKRNARTLRGFFVKGGLFIVNMHLLEGYTYEDYIKGTFHLYNVFERITGISAKKVSVLQLLHENSDNRYYDIIVLDFGGTAVRQHTDLTTFGDAHRPTFVKTSNLKDLEGERIMVMTTTINAQFDDSKELNVTGKMAWYIELQHTKITEICTEPLEARGPTGATDFTYRVMQYPMQSVPGYCGSVVIANTAHYSGNILGIHMAGYNCSDRSYGQIITFEMMEGISEHLSKHVAFKQCELYKSNTMLDNQFNKVGNIPHNLYTNSKSRIRPSLFHNQIFITQKKPANLQFFNGEHVVNKAMKKYMEPSISVSSDKEAVFYGCLMHKFAATRKIRQLTHNESISGIEGSEYIVGINRSSSAGYPFNKHANGKKGKTAFLGENETWIYDHPLLIRLIDDYRTKARNNIRPECYFVSTAKDELRPIEKVDAGKTRSFAAAPLHYVVLFRQYNLDYFATIMENKVFNSSLIGINPYSADWDVLALQLTSIAHPKSKQFIATDFTNWDGTLNRDLLWVIHSVIEKQYARKDPVSRALWQDIVTSQQVFGNVIVQIARGQPSGNPGTAIINTMYNYGITYLCLYDMLSDVGSSEAISCMNDLHRHFYVAIYGDDSIIAFDERLVNLIDITKWSSYMLKYGHYCTPETKDGGEIEFKTMSEISIIKRKFVFDEDLRIWLAPLELSSILEPLNWDRCEQEYGTKSMQMQMNSRLAIRELSMHEPHIFEEYRNKIIDRCQEHQIVLPPDCFFSQRVLRKMVRDSDNVSYFTSDTSAEYDLDLITHSSIVEDIGDIVNHGVSGDEASLSHITTQNTSGKCIYTGDHHAGSPCEESHPQRHNSFTRLCDLK